MKRLLFLAPMLGLSGCGAGQLATGAGVAGMLLGQRSVPAPAQVAQLTIWDEQAASLAELSYKAARLAMEAKVDGGGLTGEAASRAADLDNKAFAAVTGVRAAYKAANAAQYAVALGEARTAVTAMLAAIQ